MIKLKEKLKKEKAFTGLDLSISIIVIIISIAVIATMIYNLYITGAGVKRNVIATDYAINVLELVGSTEYNDVTFTENNSLKEKLDSFFGKQGEIKDGKYNIVMGTQGTSGNNFDITVGIEKYKDSHPEKEDYIKIIKVIIKYNIGKTSSNSVNEETLEISTLKTIN